MNRWYENGKENFGKSISSLHVARRVLVVIFINATTEWKMKIFCVGKTLRFCKNHLYASLGSVGTHSKYSASIRLYSSVTSTQLVADRRTWFWESLPLTPNWVRSGNSHSISSKDFIIHIINTRSNAHTSSKQHIPILLTTAADSVEESKPYRKNTRRGGPLRGQKIPYRAHTFPLALHQTHPTNC